MKQLSSIIHDQANHHNDLNKTLSKELFIKTKTHNTQLNRTQQN